jgi:hypothetical protein
MQTTVIVVKTYVDGWVNWLLPAKVSFKAIPKALIAMMEMEPTSEHIETKTSGFFLPCTGAILYTMTTVNVHTARAYRTKAGGRRD